MAEPGWARTVCGWAGGTPHPMLWVFTTPPTWLPSPKISAPSLQVMCRALLLKVAGVLTSIWHLTNQVSKNLCSVLLWFHTHITTSYCTGGPSQYNRTKEYSKRIVNEEIKVTICRSHYCIFHITYQMCLYWWLLERCCFSHVQLFVAPRTVACQALLSMGFSRQEYWSGLPCPPPGDLPDPGIKPVSLRSTCTGRRVLYH